MDIKSLEAFLVLTDQLNFTKSAEQLYISQPAFSRQITKLEDEFGCELFVRNKRKVELTEYGREFAVFAKNIFSEYEKWNLALHQMKVVKTRKTGFLRVGFLQDLPHELFPVIIRQFEHTHNSIDLSLQDCTMSNIIDGLLKNTLDVGFTLSNEVVNYKEISSLPLDDVRMCVAFDGDHPLADRESIHVQDIVNETFVMVTPEGYGPGARFVMNLCEKAGFEPKVAAYSAFVPSLLMMVNCGVGIAIVAQTAQAIAPPRVKLVPLDEDIAHVEMLLMWKSTIANPSVNTFVDFAKDFLDGKPSAIAAN